MAPGEIQAREGNTAKRQAKQDGGDRVWLLRLFHGKGITRK